MPIISESTYQKFTLLQSKTVVIDNSTIGSDANECTFELPAFAYPVDTTDTYRNDFTSSLLSLTNRYSSPEFYLEKQNGCNWDEVAQLTDSTYGTYYTFASLPNWSGFKVEWYKVYNLEGANCYRIRQEYTSIVDAEVFVNYSYKYNLKLFTANLADKTTKISYNINGGLIGSTLDSSTKIDYKDNVWEREIRLPQSSFMFESSEYEREFTRYKNGGQEWTIDNQVETIQYNVRKIPYSLHRELKITALQSGMLFISDYNLSNPKPDMYNFKRVICSSEYAPIWGQYNTYSPVQLTFKDYYENLQRKRC